MLNIDVEQVNTTIRKGGSFSTELNGKTYIILCVDE